MRIEEGERLFMSFLFIPSVSGSVACIDRMLDLDPNTTQGCLAASKARRYVTWLQAYRVRGVTTECNRPTEWKLLYAMLDGEPGKV
jgi:hypothetical protein